MTSNLVSLETYLHVLLEIEALLGGGRQLQSGLPTALQTLMQALEAKAVALNFWEEDAPQIRFDFPRVYGQMALLLPDDHPSLIPYQQRLTPIVIQEESIPFLLIPVNGLQVRYGLLQLALVKPTLLAQPEMSVILQLMGRQIGIALENAETFARLQRQTFELGILSRIGDSLLNLLSSLQIEKVAGRIMNAVKDLLDVEETSILLKDLETGDLILWQHTPPERDLSIRLKRGQGIGGWVFEHAKPAIVNDVRQDERWEGLIDQTAHFTTRSLLVVPIMVEDEVIGVVEAVNKISGAFTLADEKWMETLAKWAAVAISNANTYDELKRTHERLAEAKKQSAMAQMVLNLAHKINNSVGAIRVWTLDCLANLEAEAPRLEDLQHILLNVLDNTEETLSMVRRIRGATEMQASLMKSVDLREVLESALMVSRLPRETSVVWEFEAEVPFVAANQERLVEVFVNLLDNAADAGASQMILNVHRTENGAAEIRLQDDGEGIPEYLKNTLFDPFVTSKTQGLGLGLWMVKLYVELIGGTISVTTTRGKGSIFRITLPAWEG